MKLLGYDRPTIFLTLMLSISSLLLSLITVFECPYLALVYQLFIFLFLLSRQLCLFVLCSAFKHFYSLNSRLNEIIYLLAGFHPLDLSSPTTLLLFLPLLYFLPPYFLRIPVVALPYAYLLIVVLAISFSATFAIE